MTPGEDQIVEQLTKELPTEFGVDLPDQPVYHYTDARGLEGILRKGMVWATHYMHLNDRRELIEGEELVRKVAESMRGKMPNPDQNQLLGEYLQFYDTMKLTNVTRDVYVSSFSEVGDDLSQWRAYGAWGGGYSVGLKFDLANEEENTLAEDRGFGQTMRRVRYDHEPAADEIRKDLADVLYGIERYGRTFQGKADLVMAIYKRGMVIAYIRAARMAPVIKHPAFAAEREWRLLATLGKKADQGIVRFRPSVNGVVPYLEIDLEPGKPRPIAVEQIVVGPTLDPARGVRSVQLLLRSLGYDQATAERIVVPSAIPFRG